MTLWRDRTWRFRTGVAVVSLVCVLLVLTAAAYAYVRFRFSQVKRVHVAALRHEVSGQPIDFLVVGSDTRSLTGNNSASFGSSTTVTGQRSDVIMILRAAPGLDRAWVLSIPRDMFLPIAGTHSSNRINSAFNHGPEQLVETIQNDLHIPIQHYVLVNFQGFESVVNALGGVRLYFRYPVEDRDSGLYVHTPGCKLLNGRRALAVARSRHYYYEKNGVWQYDPTSDFGRIVRQDVFLRAAMRAAVNQGLSNPIRANDFLGAVVKQVAIDDKLSFNELLALAVDYRHFHPSDLVTYTMPTVIVNNYGSYGDVLFPKETADRRLVARFLKLGEPRPAHPKHRGGRPAHGGGGPAPTKPPSFDPVPC